jgi:hypothetical protein
MKRISLLLIVVLMAACSSADFATQAPGTGQQSPGDSSGGDSNDGTDTGAGLPAEKVPVKDILDNPDLIYDYPCSDGSDGVEICHFPEGSDGSNTQCVGAPAVYTHVDHYQASTGESDYLGACR